MGPNEPDAIRKGARVGRGSGEATRDLRSAVSEYKKTVKFQDAAKHTTPFNEAIK